MTLSDELLELSKEERRQTEIIEKKYENTKKTGRDGECTRELKKLHTEFGKRYCEIKKKYASKHSE